MTLSVRLLGFAAFVIVLVLGALFSTVVALAALLSALLLAGCEWLGWSPRWLRPAWFGGLLVAAGVVYLAASGSGTGGAIASCADIAAIGASDSEHVRSDAAAPASTQRHEPPPNTLVRERSGLTSETTRFVSVERDHVRYEERIDLHLKRGHFVDLDLTALGAQSARLQPQPQIIVGGDGMLAATFAPNELAGRIRLSTKPRSVWIETLVQVPPGAVPACRGVTLIPFQKVQLAWPQPLTTPIDGRVQLAENDEPVPFDEKIDKEPSHPLTVQLPRRALFLQRPVQLQPVTRHGAANEASDRFALIAGLDAGDLATVAELLPEQAFVRGAWVHAKRDRLFPLDGSLALLYLLVASAIGDTFLRRRSRLFIPGRGSDADG